MKDGKNYNTEEIKSCCKPKNEYNRKSPLRGIFYGILSHTGCILFIVAAILGATTLMQFFKPLLMNKNIFYYLILISILFATVSSYFYLRKNNALSKKGIKAKRNYLITMYSTTVGINLLLFFLIFPLTANFVGASIDTTGLDSISMEVKIPCPGHAPLITSELETINGVEKISYSFPNKFEVFYDSEITNQNEMLSLEVFNEYPATVI